MLLCQYKILLKLNKFSERRQHFAHIWISGFMFFSQNLEKKFHQPQSTRRSGSGLFCYCDSILIDLDRAGHKVRFSALSFRNQRIGKQTFKIARWKSTKMCSFLFHFSASFYSTSPLLFIPLLRFLLFHFSASFYSTSPLLCIPLLCFLDC